MISVGWKTIVVQKRSSLNYRNGYLIIENDEKYEVPISQIRVVIIESLQVSITTYLTNELIKYGVKVILCDEKHIPNGFAGKHHFHILNPNATGTRDMYLDKDGNLVKKNSKASHILPEGDS